MQKLVLILYFIFIGQVFTTAQDSVYWNPEQKTYTLWQQKNWKELIYWGKKALNEGHDYFYLRMRLGVAFYERGNYHRAIIQFNKAREYNDKNPYLLEYLYYANLFSGRENASLDISKHLSPEVRKKLSVSFIPKFEIHDIGVQYYWGNQVFNPDLFSAITDPLLDGSQVFTKGAFKAHLGFNHLVSRKFHLIYRYGFLAENRYTYYQNNQGIYLLQDQKLYQHQFYIRGNEFLGKGFNLKASVHYLPGKISGYSSGFGMYATYIPDYKYNDFASTLSLSKDFPYFRLGAGVSYSFLNYRNYLQQATNITFYPLGNLNMYIIGGYHWQQELYTDAVIQKSTFINYTAGFKLFYPIWLEFSGAFGDLHYTVGQDGWMVMNGPNRINFRNGLKILTSLKAGKILLSLSYFQINLDSTFQSENDSFDPFNKKNYNLHSIYGGLSWQF